MAADNNAGEVVESQEPASPTGSGSRACGVIGCLLVIGIFVALGAGVWALGNTLEPLADRFLWAPNDVVREYLTAYEERDTERARRFLCRQQQAAGLLDPAEAVGGPSAWTASVDDEFPYPRPGGRVGIYYRVVSGLGDRRAQAYLEREEDGWRICALEPV